LHWHIQAGQIDTAAIAVGQIAAIGDIIMENITAIRKENKMPWRLVKDPKLYPSIPKIPSIPRVPRIPTIPKIKAIRPIKPIAPIGYKYVWRE
jgi:hypothetical protein